MELIQQKIESLKFEISELDKIIKCARKEHTWDLVNQLIDEVQVLEKEHDELQSIIAHQKSLQEMEDYWDDEKNRDAYTMKIIDLEFSDVISQQKK